ncbi:MAG: NUDIX domain-containing protein [Myxococcales bacterium]|nr:NUDIX domain-containing protein [Myxococcales bacterium]
MNKSGEGGQGAGPTGDESPNTQGTLWSRLRRVVEVQPTLARPWPETLPAGGAPIDLATEGGPFRAGGPTLGRYAIGEEIGRGGMGVVFRAYDPDLRRCVALKIIRAELAAGREVIDRFVVEAQVTAQLQHPAIIPVYDVGVTPEGTPYYAMKLVRGRTLAAIIDQRPAEWTPFRLLQVFVQICRAVAYAHERGVIHRDLKPMNVMVGRFGEVHLMDWGLAKRVDGVDLSHHPPDPEPPIALAGGGETVSGLLLGTPMYMAPEQAAGGPIGPPADVHALGAILYELLTGRRARVGSTQTIVSQLQRGVAVLPPLLLDGAIAPRLSEICVMALAIDPAARQASAEVLADQVEGHLEGRPTGPVRQEDAPFLDSYHPAAYARPSVTVDVVLLATGPTARPRVLLLRRPNPPFAGFWALPGGFLGLDEGLEDAARRVLREKTGIEAPIPFAQLGAFGEPGRDPRMRVIGVAFLARIERSLPPPGARSGPALELAWLEVEQEEGAAVALLPAAGESGAAPQLAFDHATILAAALQRIAAP